jgi:hypothetical protein
VVAAAMDRRRSFSSTRQLARELRVAEARSSVREYLRAVSGSLREAGCTVVSSTIPLSRYLNAHLTVRVSSAAGACECLVGEDVSLSSRLITLDWSEDVGWSLSDKRLGDKPTPRRYLNAGLVPPPSVVARFVRAALDDPDSDHGGTDHPTWFRYRTQSLQPLIDKLAPYRCGCEVASGGSELGSSPLSCTLGEVLP